MEIVIVSAGRGSPELHFDTKVAKFALGRRYNLLEFVRNIFNVTVSGKN
jgi:hypothetical protein